MIFVPNGGGYNLIVRDKFSLQYRFSLPLVIAKLIHYVNRKIKYFLNKVT